MRLIDNVWVDGRCWPTGSCPPPGVAALIGEHAWEDGDPTVGLIIVGDVSEPVEVQDDGAAAPSDLDGTLVGDVLDDEPDEDIPGPAEPVDVAPPVAAETGPVTGYDNGGFLPAGPTPVLNDTGSPILVLPAPPPEPPRVGRGASRVAWVEYAQALGLNTAAEWSRDEIIATVDAVIATHSA